MKSLKFQKGSSETLTAMKTSTMPHFNYCIYMALYKLAHFIKKL